MNENKANHCVRNKYLRDMCYKEVVYTVYIKWNHR